MPVLEKKLHLNSQYFKQVLEALRVPGHHSRLVGGCVRDALLNNPSSDIDIATTLLPEQVIEILSTHHIKVVPTGIKFGTVSAFLHGEKFEITTLRKDLNCDGRRARVAFTDSFEEDAARRDFTINALSYCPFTHKIYDYFDGITALANHKVIFIRNPYERIEEDFLRILRFFRFSCYYSKTIDLEGLEACSQLKEGLQYLSRERILAELDKLIISPNSPSMLAIMFEKGILLEIFPLKNFDSKILETTFHFAKEIRHPLQIYTLYSLLFFLSMPLKAPDLINLKFSRATTTKIIDLHNFLSKPGSLNDFDLKKNWLENDYIQYMNAAISVGKLTPDKAKDFIANYHDKIKPIFPMDGEDLLPFLSGKKLGSKLTHLKQLWIESDFKLNKTQLLGLLKNEN